jgi:hypothetical protein
MLVERIEASDRHAIGSAQLILPITGLTMLPRTPAGYRAARAGSDLPP